MSKCRHYVYALIDPRDLLPKYIGKGTAARRFKHMSSIPSDAKDGGPKERWIKELQDAGITPIPMLIQWCETEAEALDLEKQKIAEIGLTNLMNSNAGGGGDKAKDRPAKLSPKQEHFATLVADGESQAVAYRAAYNVSKDSKPETVWENASRIAADSKVRARIDELKLAKKMETSISKVELEGMFRAAYRLAEETDQVGAMVSAAKELGALSDLYPAKKRENTNTNINITELTEEINKGRERVANLKVAK